MSFAVGDLVQRKGSDYKFPGTIVAVFRKLDYTTGLLDGPVRYCVQDDRGTLFIQSESTLEPRNTP